MVRSTFPQSSDTNPIQLQCLIRRGGEEQSASKPTVLHQVLARQAALLIRVVLVCRPCTMSSAMRLIPPPILRI